MRDVEDAAARRRASSWRARGLDAPRTPSSAVLPFPSQEVDPYRGLAPHLEVASARARALHGARHRAGARRRRVGARRCCRGCREPDRAGRDAGARRCSPATRSTRWTLADAARRRRLHREDPVDEHGEFCVRGGVVDFFPPASASPIRLEFIGDIIESIRRYDPATQRSVETLDRVRDRAAARAAARRARRRRPERPRSIGHGLRLRRAAPARALVRRPSSTTCASAATALERSQLAQLRARRVAAAAGRAAAPTTRSLLPWDASSPTAARPRGARIDAARAVDGDADRRARAPRRAAAGAAHSTAASPTGSPRSAPARERGETVLFVAATPGRAERTVEMLRDYDVRARCRSTPPRTRRGAAVLVATGALSRGLPPARRRPAALRRDRPLRGGALARHAAAGRSAQPRTFLSDFRDLKVGDLVVHVDNGIGGFVGLKQIGVGARRRRSSWSCATPATTSCSSRSSGSTWCRSTRAAARPALDRLGGTTWEKAKTRVKKAMRDMAEELLKLYAARKAVPGHAFSPDTHWQEEFEDAFEYELTADQTTADRRHQARHGVADADGSPALRRRRLRQDRSGDARRVQGGDGRQAGGGSGADDRARVPAPRDAASAVRGVPGAHRHDQPLPHASGAEGDRSSSSPTARSTSSSARTGCCRRTSTFRDLGLLVVDEEQRFGVAHKERIKQMRRKVDVLTMTATPIPRTLNMSLVGIRDMSVIETPPQRSPGDPDPRRQVRPERDRPRDPHGAGARRPGLLRAQPRRVDLLDGQPAAAARARGAHRRRPRPDGRGRAREGDGRLRRRTSSTCCWRRRSSRTASTSPTPTRSSSTAPIATAWRSSISCAAASAGRDRPRLRLPADPAGATRCRRSRASGWRRSGSSAISAAASASRRSTSRSAAPATCSAASRAATSRPSASRCT